MNTETRICVSLPHDHRLYCGIHQRICLQQAMWLKTPI